MAEFAAEYTDVKEPAPEIKPEVKPEIKPEPKQEAPQLSKLEKLEGKAREGGWVPLDEWNGNPEEWVSAEVFNARGPLFEKIKYQGDKVDKLEKQIHTLISMQQKIREDERKKVLADLKGQKIKQMQDGDYEGVIKTENEIEKVSKEETQKAPEMAPEKSAAKEKLEGWVNDNKWFKESIKMRAYADAMGQDYMEKHPGASIDDILDYTVKEVRDQFPDYFGEKAQPKSPVGAGGATQPRKSEKEVTMRDLDDLHRDILKGFIQADTTGRTDKQIIAETIKEWKEIGEI